MRLIGMYSTSNLDSARSFAPVDDLQTPGIEDLAQIQTIWMLLFFFLKKNRMVKHSLLAVSRGPGRFRELQEACRIISTYPGTSASPWCRIMAQNPEGFFPSTVLCCFFPALWYTRTHRKNLLTGWGVRTVLSRLDCLWRCRPERSKKSKNCISSWS